MSLTAKEQAVLSLKRSGKTNVQIAHELGKLSVGTIKMHVRNIRNKAPHLMISKRSKIKPRPMVDGIELIKTIFDSSFDSTDRAHIFQEIRHLYYNGETTDGAHVWAREMLAKQEEYEPGMAS